MVSIKEPVHFDRLSSGHSPLHPPTSVRFSPSSSRLDSSLDQLGGKKKKRWIRPFFARRNRWWRPVDVRTSFLFFFSDGLISFTIVFFSFYTSDRERETYRIITRAVLLCPLSVPGRVRVVTAAKERKTHDVSICKLYTPPSIFIQFPQFFPPILGWWKRDVRFAE